MPHTCSLCSLAGSSPTTAECVCRHGSGVNCGVKCAVNKIDVKGLGVNATFGANSGPRPGAHLASQLRGKGCADDRTPAAPSVSGLCIGTGINRVSTRIDTIPIRTDTGRIRRSGCSEPRKVKRYILVRFGVFFSTPYPFRIIMYRDVSCSYRLNNFDFLLRPRIGPVSAHDCGSRIEETRIRRIILYRIVSEWYHACIVSKSSWQLIPDRYGPDTDPIRKMPFFWPIRGRYLYQPVSDRYEADTK